MGPSDVCRLLWLYCFICWSFFSSGTSLRADTCRATFQHLQELKGLEQSIIPLNPQRLPPGIVGYHGTSGTQIIDAAADGEYGANREDGLSVWGPSPIALVRAGRIANFQLDNDSLYSWAYSHRLHDFSLWPSGRKTILFAGNYASKGSADVQSSFHDASPHVGVVIGVGPEIYQDYEFRVNIGSSNDSTFMGQFAYPALVPSRGRGIPFRYFRSLNFLSVAEQDQFNFALESAIESVQGSTSEAPAQQEAYSLRDAYELFSRTPGRFMRMLESGESGLLQIMRTADAEWRQQFQQAHPDTWGFFLELYGQELNWD